MADIEKESKKNRKKKKSASQDLGTETGIETGVDAQASVKDFVANAKNALDGLLDDNDSSAPNAQIEAEAVEAVEWNAEAADLAFEAADESNEQTLEAAASEETLEEPNALAAQLAALTAENEARSQEQSEEALAASEAEARAVAEGDEVEAMIADGMVSAADLSDADLDDATDERSDRLKELARRVAQTVSERRDELAASGELTEGEFTLTEGAEPPAMEQMGFQALEQELDESENDADPEPTEFVDNDQVISIIEAMLFSTDKPVSVATIKAVFKGTNVRTRDIQRALDILASEYASPTRGVSLEEINGGYQLRTKVDNAEFLKRLAKSRPFRLSGPALEVMAIVAYKQPVAKIEIDEIRGVESGHLLRALMERGMVAFQGKSETLPGKPMTYGSTRKFLETFGLRNIRELPTLSEIDELLPEGIGAEPEKEKLSDITASLSNDFQGGYSDNEDELLKINETLQTIDTTSEFFEQEKQRERDRRDRDRAQDIREKLMLGDEVEEKDKRWLDRYEAKLVAQEQAAAAGIPTAVAADIVEEKEIGSDLEGLSTEAREDGAEMAASTDGDQAQLDEIDAELAEGEKNDGAAVNLAGDWNEDDLESDLDGDDDVNGDDLVSNIEDDFDNDDDSRGGNA